MVAEIGHFSLILGLGIALTLAILPMLGVAQNRQILMNMAPSLSIGLFVFVAISFACLIAAFLMDDFSVDYVAHNSNSKLPVVYKVSAVWGAHEGSFLLWVLVMSGWTMAVAMFSGSLRYPNISAVLATAIELLSYEMNCSFRSIRIVVTTWVPPRQLYSGPPKTVRVTAIESSETGK